MGCCTAESRPPPPTDLWQRWDHNVVPPKRLTTAHWQGHLIRLDDAFRYFPMRDFAIEQYYTLTCGRVTGQFWAKIKPHA